MLNVYKHVSIKETRQWLLSSSIDNFLPWIWSGKTFTSFFPTIS